MSQGLIGQIVRFGVVGSAGFVVDGGLLALLVAGGVDPYLARAFSFPVAVVVTWLLNRYWTFSTAERGNRGRQFRRYLSVQVLGSLANYCVYASWIFFFGISQNTILVGFVIGSGVGAVLNFVGVRNFAFQAGAERNGTNVGS